MHSSDRSVVWLPQTKSFNGRLSPLTHLFASAPPCGYQCLKQWLSFNNLPSLSLSLALCAKCCWLPINSESLMTPSPSSNHQGTDWSPAISPASNFRLCVCVCVCINAHNSVASACLTIYLSSIVMTMWHYQACLCGSRSNKPCPFHPPVPPSPSKPFCEWLAV